MRRRTCEKVNTSRSLLVELGLPAAGGGRSGELYATREQCQAIHSGLNLEGVE